MRDSEFIRGKVPMTKEPIRLMSLGLMELGHKHHLLDIGGGTGSVSIEAAYQFPNLEVTVIEKNPEGIALIIENAKKFGVEDRCHTIFGEAPEALPDKVFDAIFVGGSGAELKSILDYAKNHLRDGGILVANFILMENFFEAFNYLDKMEGIEVDAFQMSASSYQTLGKGHYLAGVNPIMIIRGVRKDD